MNSTRKPRIGITMGDPVGIGPEVIVKALEEDAPWEMCCPLILGDPGVMRKSLTLLHSRLPLSLIQEPGDSCGETKRINLLPLSNLDLDQFFYGKPNRETGKAMVFYIKEAIYLTLEKKIDAMVTCPINKAAMSFAGYSYPGHTELLAHETNTTDYAMMLAGEKLKVVLVTIHHPLKKVPEMLTQEKILSAIRLSDRTLKKFFDIPEPKVAVAGLNPHAGEEGLFGEEEKKIIAPAICEAKTEGINVFGPLPADSLFFHAVKGEFDIVICMYHDQGLIPVKLLYFEDAVNITLGLPIVRTSVDHGTAYDIAGTGKANPKSLINAIKVAAQMVLSREESERLSVSAHL